MQHGPAPDDPAQQAPHRAGGGPRLAGYRTGRLLGAGGQGEVWAGTDELTGEDVALKVVRDPEAGHERLWRELAVLRRVEHPGVVALRDVLDAPGWGTVLVLDLAPGGSLAALLRTRGTLSAGEVVTVLCALAEALDDLHAGGVVHADVAPGNVLFTASGRPLLGDLGLAAAVALPGGPPVHGTPGFADPTATVASPAGDVRALAAVGWYALTGVVPGPPGVRPVAADGIASTAGTVALVDLLAGVLAADPAAGLPTAGELARQVWATAPALPVRLVAPDPASPQGDLLTRRLRPQPADRARLLPPPVGAGDTGAPPTRTRGRRRAEPTATSPARTGRVVAAGVAATGLLAAGLLLPTVWDRAAGWWQVGSQQVGSQRAGPRQADPRQQGPAVATGTARPSVSGSTSARPVPSDGPGPAGPEPSAGPVPSDGPGPSGPAPDADGTVGAPSVGTATPAPPPAGSSVEDPAAAVVELSRRRAAALAARDAGRLRSVTAAGSTARAADDALLERLRRAGIRLEGLDVDVLDARLLERDGTRARVRVTSAVSAHRRLGPGGRVVARVPRAAPTAVTLHLVRDAAWRVESVTR